MDFTHPGQQAPPNTNLALPQKSSCGQWASWKSPQGSFYLWLTPPKLYCFLRPHHKRLLASRLALQLFQLFWSSHNLTVRNFCLIDANGGWLMLIDSDWCSNKGQPGFLLSEHTSRVSQNNFLYAAITSQVGSPNQEFVKIICSHLLFSNWTPLSLN